MEHKMKLKDKPFNSIKNGTKTVELRLYDEKRRLLKENDTIEFTNMITGETLLVKVLELCIYDNFEELFKYFDKVSMGFDENEEVDHKIMEEYYSIEEQEKYSVVGIRIKKQHIKLN